MPRLTIDGREVHAPDGATILDAARALGIVIPTLCDAPGREHQTACLLCLVKVNGQANLVPSCSRRAEDGMRVESETDELRAVRRTGLELLLADHVGDCLAPCHHTCPAHMEIPQMLRQVAAGHWRQALATVKRDIALPAVLGRICPEVCERACRLNVLERPASICLVKRYAADQDLASGDPYFPVCRPASGKRVAIVGSGPAGLAAAYYLLQAGHACTVFDARERPGGSLRYAVPEDRLPRGVLDAEIACIERLGVTFSLCRRLGVDFSLDELSRDFGAVFLAVGELQAEDAALLGLPAPGLRVPVDQATLQTKIPGIFAGGDAVLRRRLAIRSVADGKHAARSIGLFLAGQPLRSEPRGCASRLGRLTPEEAALLASREVPDTERAQPAGGRAAGFSAAEALRESLRCLHCDCRKKDDCGLRDHSESYAAVQAKYRGIRHAIRPLVEDTDVIFEPGKCILCGLCVQITADENEPLGLALTGRGYHAQIAVPFGRPLGEALRKSADACIRACPTGALAYRNERRAVLAPAGQEVQA